MRARSTPLYVLTMASLLLALDGCGDSGAKKATNSCDSDDECGGGVCFDTSCYTACTAQDDCDQDEVCARRTADVGQQSEICVTASAFEGCTEDSACEDLVTGACKEAFCDQTSTLCSLRALEEGIPCDTRDGQVGACAAGACVKDEACEPICEGKACGDDGCGGTCANDVTANACADWNGSGHGDEAAEAFRHWDGEDPAVVQASCAGCHTTSGYLDLLGADGSASGSVDADHEPEAEGVTCQACHGDFDDFGVQRVIASVTFPSGAVIEDADNTTKLCATCHQGRESFVSVEDAITVAGVGEDEESESLTFKNIHYLAAGATLFGGDVHGAYEYPGQTYAGRFNHYGGQSGDCQGCHDSHTLGVETATCFGCHSEALDVVGFRKGLSEDYDGDADTSEGISHEVTGLTELLYAALQAYCAAQGNPIVYASGAYPYFFNDSDGDGQLDAEEGVYFNAYNHFTPISLRATYNYHYAIKEKGAFAHNAWYVMQVLYDTIEAVGGDVTGLARP